MTFYLWPFATFLAGWGREVHQGGSVAAGDSVSGSVHCRPHQDHHLEDFMQSCLFFSTFPNIPCRLRKRSTPRGSSGCRSFCIGFILLQTASRSLLKRFYEILPIFLTFHLWPFPTVLAGWGREVHQGGPVAAGDSVSGSVHSWPHQDHCSFSFDILPFFLTFHIWPFPTILAGWGREVHQGGPVAAGDSVSGSVHSWPQQDHCSFFFYILPFFLTFHIWPFPTFLAGWGREVHQGGPVAARHSISGSAHCGSCQDCCTTILWALANFLDLSPLTFPNIPCRLRKRSTPRGSSGCRRFCIRFS